ncbi:hypothetical protein [Arachnia propionica]|uniref:Uncharacterized protein n=1 Tax=Arachnia propionica TaxID=1750 RepID=A0A3P1WVR3_9ACTN|nr:hypothetical protein [Arachnia propionica]RRD50724.1 hypothetical protein EII35_03055 [Arachnia propionica]
MQCPSCHSENIQVQMIQHGQKTTHKGLGFGGRMNNIARKAVALVTCRFSNLFWKKNLGTSTSKAANKSMGVCQECGMNWELKRDKVGSGPWSVFR